jgi:hypothetical protein
MPKVSKETATKVDDYGVAEDRNEELDGYTVNFVSIRQDSDLGPLLAGLPGGRCQCPHWGYLSKGRITVRYADREEGSSPAMRFTCRPGTYRSQKPAQSSCSSARPRS